MKTWFRRLRAVVGMGVVWALAWGLIGGFVMEAIIDPNGRIVDMWPQTLAIPGFFGGVIFAFVLLMAERRRSFDELSLRRTGLWGALAGALIVLLGVSIGLNLSVAGLLIGPITVLSAASATGSLILARKASDRQRVGGAEHTRLE